MGEGEEMNYKQIIINTLIIRDGDFCQICGRLFSDISPPEIDHIQPKSNGGSDLIENLQLLHSICNRKKGGKKFIRPVQGEHPNSLQKASNLSQNILEKANLFKKDLIKSTLQENNWNETKTAQKLGITRRQLHYFMEKNKLV